MTNLKFNLNMKKILLILMTVVILATAISNVSAAVNIQFDSIPTQTNIDTFFQIKVRVTNSGVPVPNANVDFYDNNLKISTQPTNEFGVAHMTYTTNVAGVHNFKVESLGVSASRPVLIIDPNAGSGGNNPGGNNPGGNNPGGNNPGGNNPGGNNPGGNNTGANKISLEKGVIYKGKNPVGIWDGKDAYVLSSGKLVKSSSYTKQIKQAIASGQFTSSAVTTTRTASIVKFVNNVQSKKITNSAVNALSRIYKKVSRGTIAYKLISAEIKANNLGPRKFVGNNILISTNAIRTVLRNDVSTKYIARKSVKVNTLRTALAKGPAILRVNKNKSQFITISKTSNKRVTLFENNKSQKVAINSLASTLTKKKYKFSGMAITFNVKVGKSATVANQKAATGS